MYRAIAALLLVLAPVRAGAQGVVRGTVRDREGAPIASATVAVRGTTLAARTDPAGRFRIVLVPAGRVHLYAAAIAHAAADTVVALTGGDSTTVDFALAAEPLALPPVDVISSRVPHFGERPSTSVANVTPEDIDHRAVATIDEAIAHVSGVQMINGQTNIRGSTGYVQGLNSRVLMTVDGVPMNQGDRGQDQDDHLHFAAKGRWHTNNTRVDVSGAWASDRYDEPLSWCSRGECDDQGQVYQPFKVDTTELGAHTDSRKAYVTAQTRTTLSPQFAWSARGSWLRTDFTDVRRSTSEYGLSDRYGLAGQIEDRPDSTRTVVVGLEGTFSDVTSDIFGKHTQSEFAAYGQSEQRAGTVRVSGGARVDFLAVDGGSLTAVVSPRIGFSVPTDHHARDGGTLRASIGRGFRSPTMAERFVRTVALGFEVIPNPTLRPETAWSFELGHTSAPLLRTLRLDAALFWTEARDLIEPQVIQITDSTGTHVKIQLQNVVRARMAGFDASVIAAPIAGHHTTTLGYMYLSTRRQLAGNSTRGPLAFRPPHQLTLGADYTLGAAAVGADYRFPSRPETIDLAGFVGPGRP